LGNKDFLYKRVRGEERHQQVLIRIYFYTFENGLSDIKMLIENINGTILTNQKRWKV
jgi:hypothetical protein